VTRAVLVLANPAVRTKAMDWCARLPVNTRVEFKEPKRSLPQNDKMWACLTEIAAKGAHHGIKLSADDWKLLFLDALKREVRMVPNLDGNGFVSLGRSSSDLSKQEFGDLLEIIHAYAASKGIALHDPREG
jgi:hypothetical protein